MNHNRLDLSELEIGKPLPEWFLDPIFADQTVPQPADFTGKPLLILFFSLGCPGCLGRAIPYANRVTVENGEQVNVLGIHTDFSGIEIKPERFVEAQKEFYIRFPIFADQNYDTTFLDYGAGGTPHWILTDQRGIVVYSIFGSDPNNALLRLDLKMGEMGVQRSGS